MTHTTETHSIQIQVFWHVKSDANAMTESGWLIKWMIISLYCARYVCVQWIHTSLTNMAVHVKRCTYLFPVRVCHYRTLCPRNLQRPMVSKDFLFPMLCTRVEAVAACLLSGPTHPQYHRRGIFFFFSIANLNSNTQYSYRVESFAMWVENKMAQFIGNTLRCTENERTFTWLITALSYAHIRRK